MNKLAWKIRAESDNSLAVKIETLKTLRKYGRLSRLKYVIKISKFEKSQNCGIKCLVEEQIFMPTLGRIGE